MITQWNFGLIYGRGAASLAEQMKCSVEEAQIFIEKYFETFPGVKKWLDGMKKFAINNKYVELLTGRWRRLPGVDSNDRGVRSDSLRQAINAPVQGTGSEMTIRSLILINNEMKRRNLKSVLAITVHDSIVADVHVSEFAEVYTIMKTTMENLPFDWISVPILSDAEVGRDYGTLVGISSLSDLEGYDSIFDYIDKKVEEKHNKLVEKAQKASLAS